MSGPLGRRRVPLVRVAAALTVVAVALPSGRVAASPGDPPPVESSHTSTDNGDGSYRVPLLNADVPDISVAHVPASESGEGRDVYYMISTTMHLSPGAPIMKSYDLVNWEIVNYVFNRASVGDAFSLRNGRNSYGQGQWASSLRYHDGTFYAVFNTNNLGGAYLYRTTDVENGAWTRTPLGRSLHDPSLFFDEQEGGAAYIFYGAGSISAVRLDDGLTEIVATYPDIFGADDYAGEPFVGGLFEGAQVYYIDGSYYVAIIAWPFGRGGRQEVLFRSPVLLGRYATSNGHNPYEARVVLDSNGFAQGSLVPIPRWGGATDWYGMFFRDTFPIGRIPALIPATWEDGWPTFGDNGVVGVNASFPKPIRLSPAEERLERQKSIVASDDFDNDAARKPYMQERWKLPEPPECAPRTCPPEAEIAFNGSRLDTVWQWNHAPDNRQWSLTEREGWLRLTNGSVVTGEATYTKAPAVELTYLEEARNTLSQRTFGPTASVETRLDVSGMKDGDVAGLAVYNRDFAYAAIKRVDGRSTLGVVQRLQPFQDSIDQALVESFVPGSAVDLGATTEVHVKADADFASSPGQLRIRFYYSFDGLDWSPLGTQTGALRLDGSLSHFMGHRFGLFNYATEETGGHVDFDHYLLSDTLTAAGEGLDTGALDAAVDHAATLDRSDYPIDAWNAMRVALRKAKRAQASEHGTQNQIDAPQAALSLELARLDTLRRD